MTVDARHRVRERLPGFRVGYLVVMLEALDQIAVARFLVRHIDGRMTVNAGAGLLELLDTLRERLILEHVRVSALRSEVDRKRVAGPHCLQSRILLEARLRDG